MDPSPDVGVCKDPEADRTDDPVRFWISFVIPGMRHPATGMTNLHVHELLLSCR